MILIKRVSETQLHVLNNSFRIQLFVFGFQEVYIVYEIFFEIIRIRKFENLQRRVPTYCGYCTWIFVADDDPDL